MSEDSNLSRLVLVVAILVQFWILVVGTGGAFGPLWEQQRWDLWVPLYIGLTFAALVLSLYTETPLLGIFPLTLMLFALGFLAGVLLFQVPGFARDLSIPTGEAWPTLGFVVFVNALPEELLFRGFLNGYLWIGLPPPYNVAAPFASSAAWTAYHLAVYGTQPAVLLMVFVIGIGLGLAHVATMHLGGIGLPWGFHVAWNLGVVGLLTVV